MPDQRDIKKNQIEDNTGFWKEGWDKGFTGFHQSEFNPVMENYFNEKDISGKNILVPLCGKSLDMLYLANKGANVIGVEVVKEPVEDFFRENEIPNMTQEDGIYRCQLDKGSITIYNKDFFALENLGNIDYLYDRASNIALPPSMRKEKYYPTIKRLIGNETKILLLTMDHNGPQDFGPPFAIKKSETTEIYPDINLDRELSIKAMDRFQEAGIKKIKRLIWTN